MTRYNRRDFLKRTAATTLPMLLKEELSEELGAAEETAFTPAKTFKIPSGKVELAFLRLGHNGYGSLPEYEGGMAVPDGFICLFSRSKKDNVTGVHGLRDIFVRLGKS